jgi:hypothetical protein
MRTKTSRWQRFSGASGELLGFGMLAYVLYAGLVTVALWIAQAYGATSARRDTSRSVPRCPRS